MMATAVVRACRPTIGTSLGPTDCIRRPRTGAADPEETYAAFNSAPRSGRSHIHPGPRRWPRSSGHTQVGALGAIEARYAA